MDSSLLDHQSKTFEVRTKNRQRKEQLVEYLGEMLVPQTEGYDHINLDMSFTYLGQFDMSRVENISMLISICQLYNLQQANYLSRNILATLLNSARSRGAKSMDMFTTMVTKQEQEFVDKTEKKQGFSWFNFGGKKKGE